VTRLDWDREARDARLRRWLQTNPRADFVECPPPPEGLDRIDLWSRRHVDLGAYIVLWLALLVTVPVAIVVGIVKALRSGRGNGRS